MNINRKLNENYKNEIKIEKINLLKTLRNTNYQNLNVNFVKSLLQIQKLILKSNEKMKLFLNTEYIINNENKIDLCYFQFCVYLSDQSLVDGIIFLNEKIFEVLNQELNYSERYVDKLLNVFMFRNRIHIDDFVELFSDFKNKMVIVQKNYALVDNYIIQYLKTKFNLNGFYICNSHDVYYKGLYSEVLNDGNCIEIKKQDLELEINKKIINIYFNFMLINEIYHLNKLKIKIFQHKVCVNKKEYHMLQMENIVNENNKNRELIIDMKRYIIAKLNVKNEIKNGKLLNKIKINGKYCDEVKFLNCNVNDLFNNKYMYNLVIAILYKIYEEYGNLPTLLINVKCN